MVTSIQLGNFYTSNGRTVVGGAGGSGMDTESIVNSLVDAKSIPKVKLEDKITINDKKSDALGELQTLVSKLKDSANFLRNPSSIPSDWRGYFQNIAEPDENGGGSIFRTPSLKAWSIFNPPALLGRNI